MNIKGIGTDIVVRERFNNASKELISRFLTIEEIKYVDSLNGEDKIDFLSGRWATKEAIIKASNKEIIYSEISILKSNTGKPEVYINGVLVDNIHVSISHEKEYTMAFCVIEKV